MAAPSAAQFTFSPLPTASSIRLFRLTPRTTEDDFAFEVFHYELRNAPAYTALSYRWGSDTHRPSFLLNSKRKFIHQSLWGFLNQLRLEGDTSLYWSDGICINQDDTPERSQQVSMMADIYSQAHSVLVWLGPHSHIAHCLQVLRQSGHSDFMADESDETRKMARTHAVHQILSLEYWRRAWIVQEVALGNKVRLKSCNTELDYEELVGFCSESGLSNYTFQAKRADSAWALLRLIASYKSSSQAFRMGKWLSDLNGLLCKDPRDRIYSLLGLLRFSDEYETIQDPMIVDYSKSVESAFLQCAFMLLESLLNRTNAGVNREAVESVYDLLANPPSRGLLSIQQYARDPSVPPAHRLWIKRLIHEVISFQLGMAEVKDMLDFGAAIKENDHLSVEKYIVQTIAAHAVRNQRRSVFDSNRPWPLPDISGTCAECKMSAGYHLVAEEELLINEPDPLPPNAPKQLFKQILRKALSHGKSPGNGMDYILVPEDDHITISLTGSLPFSIVLWFEFRSGESSDSSNSHRVPSRKAGDNDMQDTKLDYWWFVARRSKLEDEKGMWRVYPALVPGSICSCSQDWRPESAPLGTSRGSLKFVRTSKP